MQHDHGCDGGHSQKTGWPSLDRRGFLCRCCLGGAATAAMLAGLNRPALANEVTFKATHGTGLCNMAIFLAHKRKYAEKEGLNLEFVATPAIADITTIFGSGQVDISSIPYTNFFTLVDKGAPVKIIAGTGVEGIVLVSQPGLDTAEKLKGKTLGTFQADTLEVTAYDWLKKHGVAYTDVDVRFFGSVPELTETFIAGKIDVISQIEPYATQALMGVPGSHLLSDGSDLYGPRYTDCVIAASDRVIAEHRDKVKVLVKALMMAQHDSEKDRVSAVKDTVGTYYKADFDTVLNASTTQYLMVDQRANQQFMLDRAKSVNELGYISKTLDGSMFDWSILQEVAAENRDLYRNLIVV
ncbi:MAG: ABC transporter substrate-binding protein [Parvibaculaceae bacterium]